MAVYGEEAVQLDISGGLWLADDNGNEFQQGFATGLKNLVRNPKGFFEPRKAFKHLLGGQSSSTTQVAISDFGKFAYEASVSQPYVIPVAGYGPNSPIAFVPSGGSAFVIYNYSGPLVANLLQTSTTNTSNSPKDRSVIVYKDRMYACKTSTGAWYRYTGWGTFTGAPPITLTEVLLPGTNNTGMTNLTGSFAFQNRLFCYTGSRVYYTDLASTGGYPETWDNTVNFFDIPSVGSPIIWNAVVTENLVYLFTEEGVYTLQVYGPPSSWIVRPLNLDIKVRHHMAVVNNGPIIYYVNNQSVYAFNGEKTQDIGAQLESIFVGDSYDEYGVVPFEKGILLSCQKYGAVTSGSAKLQSARTFYFDGSVWTEFTIKNATIFTVVNCAAANIALFRGIAAGGPWYQPTSVISCVVGVPGDFTFCMYYYDNNSSTYRDDDTSAFAGATYGGTINCSVTYPWYFGNPSRMKNFKYGYLDLYGVIKSITYSAAPDADDGDQTISGLTQSIPNSNKHFNLVKFKTPGIGRGVQVSFNFDNISTNRWSETVRPSMEIRGAYLVLDTGRNAPDSTTPD